MLNLNQNPNFRTVHTLVFAHHCAQLSYTTQHRAVLVIFPPELQTSIKAQMLSIGKEGEFMTQINGTWHI